MIKAPISSSEGLFGGACLAIRGPDCICFFDWNEGAFLCKIDVAPSAIYWNDTQELVLLVCEELAFVLKYEKDAVDNAIADGSISVEVGVPGAFEPEHEISGKIDKGQWVGDCFVFSNGSGRLNYFVGGNTMTLAHLDQQSTGPLFMLGYLPKEDKVYFMDRSRHVVSYRVLLAVLQYQTAVVRRDFDSANAILPAIPDSEHSSVARFLEAQGYKDVALQVSKDVDHKFDLALELGRLDVCTELLDDAPANLKDTTDTTTKWKRLGDLALSNCDLALAERCARNAKDLAGLLMLHTATGDRSGVLKLADDAVAQGKLNIAFVSFFILGEIEKCFELLIETERIPEAALLARTYLPSQISRAVTLWRNDLARVSERAAAALADPTEYPNLFPDLNWALKVEEVFKQNRNKIVPASEYLIAKDDLELDLIALVKEQHEGSWDLQEEPSLQTAQDFPCEDDAVDGHVLDVPPEDRGKESECKQIDIASAKDAPNSSMNDEADAILNDDFGDDDDW